MRSKLGSLGVLAVTAGVLTSTGCSDTTLVGSIDDSELQDPQVLPLAGLGMSREINDLIYANLVEFDHTGGLSGLTDGHIAGAIGTTGENQGVGNVDRSFNGAFEQTHEAVWAGYKVVDLALGQLTDEAARQSPVVAKGWLNAGWMERVMADAFCESVYRYGPFGGFNLSNLSDWEPGPAPEIDPGHFMQKDSMYQRVAYAMQQAIDVAEAAIAAGVEPPDIDPDYFEPAQTRMSAYAGLAQAHASLAQLGVDPAENWAAAVAAAGEVDNDHVEFWNTDDELRNNQNWINMWTDNEISIWSGVHNGRQWGAAITQVAPPGDPRVQLRECQNFETLEGPESEVFSDANVVNTDLAFTAAPEGCDAPFERGTSDIEIDGVPRWLDARFEERFHDVAAVRGTQMRLIEAEAALFNNDLETFTQKINEIRNFHGAPTITQPATVGSLEFPNALDDAWSILDGEALLEHWGELRRLAFLHNWNHPFITENHTLLPFYRDVLEAQGAGFQRASCLPIPSNECALNPAVTCPDV